MKAGLDEKIFPTEQGLVRLEGKIDAVNRQIGNAIRVAGKRGMIETDKVVKQLSAVKRRFKSDLTHGKEILQEVDALRDKILKEQGPLMTAQKAQEAKVILHRNLKKKYLEIKDHTIEGQKALAKGLRIQLEKLYPEIKNLNVEHKALRGLEKEITRAAGRIRNREIISLLASTSAAAGGAAYQGPEGLMYGLAVELLVSPRSKTAIAIALNRAIRSGGAVTLTRRLAGPRLVPEERNERTK